MHANPIQEYGVQVERMVGGEKVLIPTSLIQIIYAANMRGVDTQDQVCATYST